MALDLKPMSEIAPVLGFEAQEATTLIMHIAPEILVVRKGVVHSDINLVVNALDDAAVVIPRDPRSPQYFRRNPSAPMLPAPRSPNDGADGSQGDDYSDEKPVEAEVIEDEPERRPQVARPAKRARRMH